MKNKVIKLNESEFKNIIIEAVKNTLSEMNWKTYINAARGFYDAGDIEKAHKLEKYAQEMFQKEHGKNGYSHQYEYDSPSYGGRRDYSDSDKDFEVKSPTKDGYWFGEKAKIRNYRYGNGIPYLRHGELHDDTFDYAEGYGFTGNVRRKHTMKYDEDGEKYDPYNSSVGNEVSMSKDKNYNAALDDIADDLKSYYTNKSKYRNGKWTRK